MRWFNHFLLLIILWLFFLTFTINQPLAQVSQNIVLSCLDGTPLTEPNQTINGVAYHHLVKLSNREPNIFTPSQPVYIIRSLARVFCNPNDNDPECLKDSQNRISPCIQEEIGANICNQNCPWGNHTCTKNNAGANKTVCCMPLYTKQGPYFECANDKNNQSVCPQSIMSQPGQNNGIHPSEDGHIETGLMSNFLLVYNDKNSLVADPNGNIVIEAAQDYTGASLDHGYYGMQIVSDQAINNSDAFRYNLKLALFAKTEEVEPSATDCTTVFWDPYGKVIDALRLEPVSNLPVLLKNLSSLGQVVETSLPDNPTFRNPETTDLAGNFNFAVSPGTYFLEPLVTNFSFPINQDLLNKAIANLQVFDPEQEYIRRDKIYNNANEPIIELAGSSERRDIILEPKDPAYQGTIPSILYAENLRHENGQLIRGRVSHPKSIVRIYLGTNLVGQTEADMTGGFSLFINQSVIDTNTGALQVLAEKVPLNQNANSRFQPGSFLSKIFKEVLAQQSTVSEPYSLSLIPVRLTGFVFDHTIKIQPHATVQLTIPSLGGLIYSQTVADKDGYININATNLPPFDFVLTVKDQNKSDKNFQLTIDDFKKTNTVFLSETKTNLYNAQENSQKPDQEMIDKIIKETPNRVPANSLSLNQPSITPTESQTIVESEETNNSAFVLVFAFVILLIILVGFFVVKGKGRSQQLYY